MTEKAQAVLQKMKLRKLFPSRIPQSGNEPVATAGGDQGMSILNESNDLGLRQEQIIREAVPKMTVY